MTYLQIVMLVAFFLGLTVALFSRKSEISLKPLPEPPKPMPDELAREAMEALEKELQDVLSWAPAHGSYFLSDGESHDLTNQSRKYYWGMTWMGGRYQLALRVVMLSMYGWESEENHWSRVSPKHWHCLLTESKSDLVRLLLMEKDRSDQ